MMDAIPSDTPAETGEGTTRAALGLATVFALLSATCCVLPIGLSIVGLGGAWLAVLGPFTEFRPVILLVVAVVVAFAWWRIIRRRKCGQIGKSALFWTTFASIALLASVTAPMWEGEAQRALWSIWMDTR